MLFFFLSFHSCAEANKPVKSRKKHEENSESGKWQSVVKILRRPLIRSQSVSNEKPLRKTESHIGLTSDKIEGSDDVSENKDTNTEDNLGTTNELSDSSRNSSVQNFFTGLLSRRRNSIKSNIFFRKRSPSSHSSKDIEDESSNKSSDKSINQTESSSKRDNYENIEFDLLSSLLHENIFAHDPEFKKLSDDHQKSFELLDSYVTYKGKKDRPQVKIVNYKITVDLVKRSKK